LFVVVKGFEHNDIQLLLTTPPKTSRDRHRSPISVHEHQYEQRGDHVEHRPIPRLFTPLELLKKTPITRFNPHI